MTPTRDKVRNWLRACVEQYEALIDARETDLDSVAGWQEEQACARAALAALDDAERMDWIERTARDTWENVVITDMGKIVVGPFDEIRTKYDAEGDTLRAAIDAARKETT